MAETKEQKYERLLRTLVRTLNSKNTHVQVSRVNADGDKEVDEFEAALNEATTLFKGK